MLKCKIEMGEAPNSDVQDGREMVAEMKRKKK